MGKYLKRQYKRALRVDYNAGALDRWKSNWYKSLRSSWIILFSLVVIRQDIPYPTQTFQSQEGNIPTCTICVFVIMLQFIVQIQNIHVASTITQDNQLQAWKPAEQQNRPRTSVSTSGKSSGKLIMANMSELKFPFERRNFKQVVWTYASCQISKIRPHPV